MYFLIVFHWCNWKWPGDAILKHVKPFIAIFHILQKFEFLEVETALFENYAILGKRCDLNCPHSPSNEKLFSCDYEMWKKILVWSPMFEYFEYHKSQLAVIHPVFYCKKVYIVQIKKWKCKNAYHKYIMNQKRLFSGTRTYSKITILI